MLIDGLKLREGSINSNIVIPSMTTSQRDALAQPDVGELAYITDGVVGIYVFNGSSWNQLDSFNASNISSGVLAVAYGGTGGTTAAEARAAIEAASSTHTHSDKQDVLVSGVNIKTIENIPILGSGNITLPEQFVLQPASSTTLGGVKVDGSTISINSEGVISVTLTYNLPAASLTSLGGVIVDDTTIKISDSGVISVASELPPTNILNGGEAISSINDVQFITRAPADGGDSSSIQSTQADGGGA